MHFIPISPADFKRLEPCFKGQKYPLSSYCLSGIVAWNNCAFNNYCAVEDGTAYVSESHINDPAARWLLLPVSLKHEFPPHKLAELLKKTGFAEYRYVPEDYVLKYGEAELAKHFIVTHHPEYDDYIYKQTDIAELKGSKYSPKRNLISQFERANGSGVEVSPLSGKNAAECLAFIKRWYSDRAEKYKDWTDDLGCERQALIQTIENFDAIGVKGIAVRIRGELWGLGIASRVTDNMGVLNFEKAFDRIKGLYQFLEKQCAIHLFEGCEFVNRESDLGEAGLRKSKESYHPVRKVKCYTLHLPPAK